jgi:hypothetical protein
LLVVLGWSRPAWIAQIFFRFFHAFPPYLGKLTCQSVKSPCFFLFFPPHLRVEVVTVLFNETFYIMYIHYLII